MLKYVFITFSKMEKKTLIKLHFKKKFTLKDVLDETIKNSFRVIFDIDVTGIDPSLTKEKDVKFFYYLFEDLQLIK